jgi:hypothetical protein
VEKWDVDNHTSSRSLTHLAGNLNNKPAARNDHTAQPKTEPAPSRFALKPLALALVRRFSYSTGSAAIRRSTKASPDSVSK